ncbi:MAG: hypothetical protein RBS14_00840 [Atribacterota bacterium]|jgi:hypothetical protein|nr:hypothetical protein [Atribacterota bacterium]
MTLTGREKDAFEALTGTAKSVLSLIPGLGQAIAGWDAYRRSQFDRSLLSLLQSLEQKVNDVRAFASSEWLQSEDGQQFCWKVFSSALDSQIEEKQELFLNALIQGTARPEVSQLEKLKFIDMLRHLSKAALMVLADMHAMFGSQVREAPAARRIPSAPIQWLNPQMLPRNSVPSTTHIWSPLRYMSFKAMASSVLQGSGESLQMALLMLVGASRPSSATQTLRRGSPNSFPRRALRMHNLIVAQAAHFHVRRHMKSPLGSPTDLQRVLDT